MNYINKRFKSMLAFLIMSVFALNIATAEELKEPERFSVKPTMIEGIAFTWFYSLEAEYDGFRIYRAEGITQDLDDFELYEVISKNDENLKTNPRGRHMFYSEQIPEYPKSSYYITAYYGKEESDESNIGYHIKDTLRHDYIRFTSEPEQTASVGEDYYYDAEVETTHEDVTFQFALAEHGNMPANTELDPNTGELTFNADESGSYFFKISVQALDRDDNVVGETFQKFRVWVSECSELAKIKFEVVNEEGEDIEHGMAFLSSYNKYNDSLGRGNPGRGMGQMQKIIDGEVKFENLDKGKYVVAFNAEGYENVWYVDANNPWDATPIEVDCAEEHEYTVTMTEFVPPEMYSISGVVRDAETDEPINGTLVEILMKTQDRQRPFNRMARTGENGEYKFESVPENTPVYVRAGGGRYILKDGDSLLRRNYIPQYWDHVSDMSEATALNLTEDVTDINFDLEKMPSYTSSISGNVVNDEGETLENTFVVAFMVDGDDMMKHDFMRGRTILNGDDGFKLERLAPGEYILFALEASFTYLPGYYVENDFATLTWDNATRVTLQEDDEIENIEIKLQLREPMGGGGIIQGYVSGEPGGSIQNDDEAGSNSITGANIYLTDGKGKSMKAVQTSQDGSYTLNRVAYGNYELVIDKIGYEPVRTPIVIDDEKPVVNKDVTLKFEQTTSVEDGINNDADHFAFPNPANDNVTLSFKAAGNNTQITVTDAAGNIVLTKQLQTVTGLNTQQLTVNDLSAGKYFISIYSGGVHSTIPLVIQ